MNKPTVHFVPDAMGSDPVPWDSAICGESPKFGIAPGTVPSHKIRDFNYTEYAQSNRAGEVTCTHCLRKI